MEVTDLDILLVTMCIDVTVIKSKCQFLFRLFYTGGLFEAIRDEKDKKYLGEFLI